MLGWMKVNLTEIAQSVSLPGLAGQLGYSICCSANYSRGFRARFLNNLLTTGESKPGARAQNEKEKSAFVGTLACDAGEEVWTSQ